MTSSGDKAIILGLVMLALVIASAVFYSLGQLSIVKSCEHTSFFYSGDKTFECLPYHKGMLEHETAPDLRPPR